MEARSIEIEINGCHARLPVVGSSLRSQPLPIIEEPYTARVMLAGEQAELLSEEK